MILFLFEEVYKKRIKDGPLGKPIEQEKTDVHVSTSIFEIRNNKKKEVPDDLENHIYVKYNFHVDENEVKKVIHQILTHDTNDNSHDDSFSWIELVNIVEKWEKRVGFSWNKPDEMKDSSKFRILPVFYETIRLGSRKDQSTSPDYLVIYAWFVICFIILLFRVDAICLIVRQLLQAKINLYEEKITKSIFLLTSTQLEINHAKNVAS